MKSDRHITLKCGTKIYLDALEDERLSYVPCGQDRDGKDTPLLPFAHLWNSSRQVKLSSYGKKANPWRLDKMTGVQLMTGKPSNRGDALLIRDGAGQCSQTADIRRNSDNLPRQPIHHSQELHPRSLTLNKIYAAFMFFFYLHNLCTST